MTGTTSDIEGRMKEALEGTRASIDRNEPT
jgi:hypothetical protein